MSAAVGNKNTHSSSIIDGILGRKNKGKANGTVIDTATGAPPTDDQSSGTTAEPNVTETAAIAEQKHNLEASQQNAEISTPTAKPEPEPEKTVDSPAAPAAPAEPAPVNTPTSAPAPAPTSAPVPAIAEPSSAPATDKTSEPTPTDKAAAEERTGRPTGKEFQSYSAPRETERSVSPGTLPDGRHAQTAGDRGEGYTPPSKMGKLGAKLGFGHH